MSNRTAEQNSGLPKLLRAIAKSENAVMHKHDVIFNAAADELDQRRGTIAEQGSRLLLQTIANAAFPRPACARYDTHDYEDAKHTFDDVSSRFMAFVMEAISQHNQHTTGMRIPVDYITEIQEAVRALSLRLGEWE